VAKLDGYDILPLEDSAELYREGAAMHHCVGAYADQVKAGYTYIYSIRRNGERLATAELIRVGQTFEQVLLGQIRGPCNAEVSKEIVMTVRKWLHAQQALPPCA